AGLCAGIRAPLSLSTQAPSMYIDRSPTGAVRLVVGAFIGLSFRRDVRRQPASSGRIEQVDFGEVGENCNAIADADTRRRRHLDGDPMGTELARCEALGPMMFDRQHFRLAKRGPLGRDGRSRQAGKRLWTKTESHYFGRRGDTGRQRKS